MKPRQNELEQLILYHRDKYYNEEPEISDEEFDKLFDELKKLDPDNPVLKETGISAKNSPWQKAEHEMPMFSLDRFHTIEEFENLYNKLGVDISFSIEHKLDGFSLELVYDKGKLQKAITRGNGVTGEDMYKNVVKMKNVKKQVSFKERFSLRAEGIILHEDFEKLNAVKLETEGSALVNPRNGATGTSKRLDGKYQEYITVIYYDAWSSHLSFNTQKEKLEWIKSLGLDVVKHGVIKSVKEAKAYFEQEMKDRLNLNYDIDGLVVKLNDLKYAQKIEGSKRGIPKTQQAWKFPNAQLICQLIKDVWSLQSGSRITPIGVVKPMYIVTDRTTLPKIKEIFNSNDRSDLSKIPGLIKVRTQQDVAKSIGAKINNVTMNNLEWIKEMNVGLMDIVLIERANDVIPKLVDVIFKQNIPIKHPKNCPCCNEPTVVDGRFLLCSNPLCKAKELDVLMNWISTLNLRDIGFEIVNKLYSLDLVKEPADFYSLTVDQIAELDGMGEIMGNKIVNQFKANLEIPLVTFLNGLAIEGFKSKSIQKLVDDGYDTLEKILNLTIDDISSISGLGEKSADQFLSGLQIRKRIIENLLEKVKITAPQVIELKSNKFDGKTFCITGTLSKPRKDIELFITENGGVLKGVNKKLDYLVVGENAGSKLSKAQSLGITILSEDELLTF